MPPFPNPDVITFTRRIGKTIESSSLVLLANLTPFTNNLESKGFSYHVEPQSGTPYALVAWIPRDDTAIISDVWEIAANDFEKNIWELPTVRTEFMKLIKAPGTVDPESPGNLYYQWHAFIQRVVLGKVEGAEEVPSWAREADGIMQQIPILTDAEFKAAFTMINSVAGLPATVNGKEVKAVDYQVFADLAACLSRGVDAFPVGGVVARRTQILPPNNSIKKSLPFVNKIFTRAQFLALTFPDPVNDPPPQGLVDSLPEGYYQYKSPTMILQRDGTWQLNEEWYWSEEYDHFVYNAFKWIVPPAATAA